MTNQRNKSLAILSATALALLLTMWSPVQSQSGTTPEGKKMMESCQEMMEQKQQMMATMKAQDADLTAQVARMNSAPANERLDLLAAVVTHMVEHQTSMTEKMEAQHQKMMGHMMQHMQMGQASMAQCPMMKEMKAMDDPKEKAHTDHPGGTK